MLLLLLLLSSACAQAMYENTPLTAHSSVGPWLLPPLLLLLAVCALTLRPHLSHTFLHYIFLLTIV